MTVVLPIILFSFIAIPLILMVVFTALWTYTDAKNRGLNAPLWTLVVIFVPNLIGLLIYILVGRAGSKIQCPNCSRPIASSARYCDNCGVEVNYENIELHPQKSAKKFAVAAIVSVSIAVLMIIAFIITAFWLQFRDDKDIHITSGISTVEVEKRIGNEWNLKFGTSTKTYFNDIKIKDGSPQKLILSGGASSGDLILMIYQDDLRETVDLSYGEENYEVDLKQFKDGWVTLELTNVNAKNAYLDAVWE